jgi:AcrR family transcriptional regulator
MTPTRPLPPEPDPNPFEDPIAIAIVDVIIERGYEAARVEEAIERAGITREEFDRRFEGKEDCVLKTYEAYIAHFERTVQFAFDSQPAWPASLRAAAYAASEWMANNPNQMRFGAVEVLAAESEMVRVRREEVARFCVDLVDAGRAVAPDPEAVPESAAMMAIGSILQMLTSRLERETEVDPVAATPDLMYIAVRPYLGEEIARAELTAPRPQW